MPNDWPLVKLRDIAAKTRNALASGPFGSNLGTADYLASGIPVIRGTNLNYGEHIGGAFVHVSEDKAAQLRANLCSADDIVVTQRGTVGQVALVPKNGHDKYLLSQSQMKVTIDPTLARPRYVLAQLLSVAGQRYLRSSKIQTGLPHINLGILANTRIPLPPLSEQDFIIEAMDRVHEVVRAADMLMDRKQVAKAAIAEEMLSARRRFSQFATPWRETYLGEVFVEVRQINSDGGVDLVITVGKNAIRPQEEHFRRLVASAIRTDYNVIYPAQFVYDPMSAYYGAMGQYRLAVPGIVSPVYRVLDVRPGFDPEFLRQLMKSRLFAARIQRASTQGNKDGKRRGLQRKAFDLVKIRLPALNEQQHIGAALGDLDLEIDLLLRQRDAIIGQKKGLMQKLLTGEIRAKGLDT